MLLVMSDWRIEGGIWYRAIAKGRDAALCNTL
jgi:hypothetical protein